MELLAVGLIVHLILVVFVGIVAKGKNRDVVAWVLLSIFLPLLGLIIVAIIPRKEITPLATNRQPKLDISQMTKACPECAEEIKLLAKVCRYCGYRFSDDGIIELRNSAEKDTKIAGVDYCLRCVEYDRQTGKCRKTWFSVDKLKKENKLSNPCDFKYFRQIK